VPFTTHNGVRLYWRTDGLPQGPTVVLLNSIGTGLKLWDPVVQLMGEHFQFLRLDTRGHGASEASNNDYSLEMLASDLAAVMTAAGVEKAALAGISLGGMIAMQFALDQPQRVSALMLICTSPAMDPTSWAERVALVREQGTSAIAEMAVGRFLSPAFVASRPQVAAGLRAAIRDQANEGYAGAGAAIRDMALIDRIADITAPTLVVTATEDVSTPFEGHGDVLLATISGARHVAVPGGHLPQIEAPGQLAAAITEFLEPRLSARSGLLA